VGRWQTAHATASDELMDTVARLTAAAEALAAVGTRARAQAEGLPVPEAVAERLDAVCAALGVDVAAVDPDRLAIAAAGIRAFFLQAGDLLADPARAPGWTYTDAAVLENQGRLSAVIAERIAALAPQLDGLALDRPGAAVCDVGAGIAALSVALCRRWPALRVVGLEPWEPAMSLAAATVAASEVADRIELRAARVEDLADRDAFDAIWLPLPFLAPAAVPAGLRRCLEALRPGGWMLAGLYAAPADPLASALVDLRTVRSGGRPYTPAEAARLLAQAGYAAVAALERQGQAPVRFVVGRRP